VGGDDNLSFKLNWPKGEEFGGLSQKILKVKMPNLALNWL
jgi:hypothetical protein